MSTVKAIAFSFLLVLAIVSWGCPKTPSSELADANAALKAARDNCADVYAAEDYERAQRMIQSARKMSGDENRESRKQALSAVDLAEKASRIARERQGRAKTEAETALANANKAIERAERDVLGVRSAHDDLVRTTRSRLREEGIQESVSSRDRQELEKRSRTVHLASEGMLDRARTTLQEAQRQFERDPCSYGTVRDTALQVADQASNISRMAATDLDRIRQTEQEISQLVGQALHARPSNYVVVRGDTLWDIAAMEKIYNNPFKWPLIWKANRQEIRDPDLILPSQQFNIPREYSERQKDDALRYARTRYAVWPMDNFLNDGK